MSEKFIYFDLGGVMFEYKHSLTRVASALGFPIDTFTRAWVGPDDNACRGDISPKQMWVEILQALHYQGEITDLTNQWVDGFTPNLKVHELLTKVSQYCAVGVLSNLYQDLYPVLLKRGLVANINWNVIILSSDIKSRKPESEMFATAEQRSGRHPSQLVFLDDKQVNVAAAISRGWHGVLYDNNNPQVAVDEVLNLL